MQFVDIQEAQESPLAVSFLVISCAIFIKHFPISPLVLTYKTKLMKHSALFRLTCCIVLLMYFPILVEAQQKGFITTRGKEVIGPNGKPFLMRGTNLGNWLVPEGYMWGFQQVNSPRLINQVLSELTGPSETRLFWKQYLDNFITAADIHYLRSLGMNSIRVPFNYRLFTKENYLGENNENHGFELLDRLIKWCKKEQLYVVLDMHCAPGGQTGDNIDDGDGYPFLYDSKNDKELTTSIWKRIARYYKNDTTVLGYDLLNEPIAHYFDKAHFNPKLEPLYKMITAAIRTVDNNHIIIVGGAQWDSNFQPFGPPFDHKLIYEFHKYWTAPTKEVIKEYLTFRDKYNVPIYCGETGENTDQWVDSFRVVLEQNAVGWHYWPYKKLQSASSVVQIKKPSYYDDISSYTEKVKQNFADIRKSRPENMDRIRQALKEYLINCRFENCVPNKGYSKALGFE